MKVIIEEANAKPGTGIFKYYESLKDLLEKSGIEYIIYSKNFLNNPPIIRRVFYFLWLNIILPLKMLRFKEDVILIGVNYYLPFFKIPNVYYLPVIYDLIAIKFSSYIPKWNSFIIKFLTNNAIRNAYRVITISETVKKEISENYKYPVNRIKVLNPSFTFDTIINIDENEVLSKFNLVAKKYLLSVSSFSEYKNINSLILAFEIYQKKFNTDLKLVLVGVHKSRINKKNDHIIYTGFVDDEELKVLYKKAKAYNFPSLIEGFGIPIIDAQEFGVPIICSDIPVFKEIASENGAIFCGVSPQNIANAIEMLLNNNDLEKSLINVGKENIKRFSIENRLKQLSSILRK